jgi:multiple sugar transport system ATP-binding protein
MSYVELRSVVKRFGTVEVIHDLDLSIEKGQFVVLVGPSGCGKSTALRMVAGLEAVTAGEISIDGRIVNDVHPRDRDIAMVFQNYALYPDKNVYDNMAFGLRMRKMPIDEIQRRVDKAAEILGLHQLLERKPAELSGGQRQRVAVGRAIVREPKVFLFDEPLSNLDAHLRVHMRAEIVKLHRKLEATMLYVTHDQVEAMTMGDVIAILRDGDLVQFGAPLDIFRRPNSVFVGTFIGSPSMNIMRMQLTSEGGKIWVETDNCRIAIPDTLATALQSHIGREILLGLRPQLVAVGDKATDGGGTDNLLNGRVEVAEHLGTESILVIDVEGHAINAEVELNESLRPDMEVPVRFDLSQSHFFDCETENIIVHAADVISTPLDA